MTQADYDEVSDKALRLFEFGQVSRLLMLLEKVTLVSLPAYWLLVKQYSWHKSIERNFILITKYDKILKRRRRNVGYLTGLTANHGKSGNTK